MARIRIGLLLCVLVACDGSSEPDASYPDECGPIRTDGEQPNTLRRLINLPTTLKASCSPYHIDQPVAVTAELTIEAGVRVVACQGGCRSRITIGAGGKLLARGSEGSPIVFTSEYEGPLRGQWTGLLFLEALPGSLLQHVVIELAGGPYSAAQEDDEFSRYEFPVEGSLLNDSTPDVELDHVTIKQSRGYAIAATTIDNFSQNIYARVAAVTILDSAQGVWIPVDQGGSLGGDLCWQERDGDGLCPPGPGPAGAQVELHIDDNFGRIPESVTRDATWAALPVPYQAENIDITNGALLTLADGVDLRMTNLGGITVGVTMPGAFQAVAAAPGGIHIGSSFADPNPTQYWRGISIWDLADDERTHIENAVIEYGGRKSLTAEEAPAIIQIFNANPTIVGNHVAESLGSGIHWNCMSAPPGLEVPPSPSTNSADAASIACAEAVGSDGIAENFGCPCPGTPDDCRLRCPQL